LLQIWVSLRLSFLETAVTKKHSQAAAMLESLLDPSWKTTVEQKSSLYRMLGDLALAQVRYGEAQFLYEQAQNQKDSAYLQEKLDFLAKTRNEKTAPAVTDGGGPEAGGEEVALESRIQQSLQNKEFIAALKDCVTLLNQYPGSRPARRLRDRPLEIYNSLNEKAAQIKALNEMENLDSSRLQEWAQSLYRRGDFVGALRLAQRVIDKSPGSAQMAVMLAIAGRSSQFTGSDDKALEFYQDLIQYHNGSDEAAEALFRSALIHYRKKNYSSTSALLEKLLQQKRDRYDLSARYWWVRALQETHVEKAQKLAAEIIERYPFSYYGLRLRAESQGGRLSWPEFKDKAPSLKSEIYLSGGQKKSWQRYKMLSAAGWVNEAQLEFAQLPFVKDASLKVQWALQLANLRQYMPAIRLLNEAMEAEPQMRREQFVKVGYPPLFDELYQTEGSRYGIEASLLQSLTRQESAFNMRAVSSSNALGLMQMIPPTAQEVARKLSLKIDLPGDMFQPETNIAMGSYYFSQMLGQFGGHVPLALAAYNAGPGRVRTWVEANEEMKKKIVQKGGSPQDEVWFDELPWSETSFYIKAILRNVLLYRLVQGKNEPLSSVFWLDLMKPAENKIIK
ncbi:MAG: transglycosylase SLT domain-containing protein, partial [Bdellovibrio sp.]